MNNSGDYQANPALFNGPLTRQSDMNLPCFSPYQQLMRYPQEQMGYVLVAGSIGIHNDQTGPFLAHLGHPNQSMWYPNVPIASRSQPIGYPESIMAHQRIIAPRRGGIARPPELMAGASNTARTSFSLHTDSVASGYRTASKLLAREFLCYQKGLLRTDNLHSAGVSSGCQNDFLYFGSEGQQQMSVVHHRKQLSAMSATFVPSEFAANGSSLESGTIQKLQNLQISSPPPQRKGLLALSASSQGIRRPSTSLRGQSSSAALMSSTSVDKKASTKFIRAFNARKDRNLKDIVIENGKVMRNIVRMREMRNSSSDIEYIDTGDFSEGIYYFEDDLAQMKAVERAAFWTTNWVEININLDWFHQGSEDAEDQTKQLVDVYLAEKCMASVHAMNKLGGDFVSHTRTVFINIEFPEDPRNGTADYMQLSLQERMKTNAYHGIQNIVNKLKELKALARLVIIFRTQAHSRNVVSVEQLHYALPFCELPFTDWQLKWRNTYMRSPEELTGWPIHYLNTVREKIDRGTAYARRKKKRPQQKTSSSHSAPTGGKDVPPNAPRGPRSKNVQWRPGTRPT